MKPYKPRKETPRERCVSMLHCLRVLLDEERARVRPRPEEIRRYEALFAKHAQELVEMEIQAHRRKYRLL